MKYSLQVSQEHLKSMKVKEDDIEDHVSEKIGGKEVWMLGSFYCVLKFDHKICPQMYIN